MRPTKRVMSVRWNTLVKNFRPKQIMQVPSSAEFDQKNFKNEKKKPKQKQKNKNKQKIRF